MPTILAQGDRELIVKRLRQLTPDTKPIWGTLTAPRLLCHLSDQLRVSLGEAPMVRRDTALTRTLLKWLVIYSPIKAPPGKVQTSPEMLTTPPGNWQSDLERTESLIQRLAITSTTAAHPKFGPLSHDGWGRLTWKHLDHHLRQFGV
jgi:Protein of unknown function (DUF1569)